MSLDQLKDRFNNLLKDKKSFYNELGEWTRSYDSSG